MKGSAMNIPTLRFRLLVRGVDKQEFSLEVKRWWGWSRVRIFGSHGPMEVRFCGDDITFGSLKEAQEWVEKWYGANAYIQTSTWRVA